MFHFLHDWKEGTRR